MADNALAIDFGTTFTAAALIHPGGEPRALDIESAGSHRMESGVFLGDDGELATGSVAANWYVLAPERYERTPKRWIQDRDSVLYLGDNRLSTAQLVAAVLRRVLTAAAGELGGEAVQSVCLTHPAEWAQGRRSVLEDAAGLAGLSGATLVPEPVAAAMQLLRDPNVHVAPGEHVAVYDFGGGTFDAAVLRRSDAGFEVVGEPMGRDPLGGEDIDQRIIDHLGQGRLGEREEWARLVDPPDGDTEWLLHGVALRRVVQEAKRNLSTASFVPLHVPGLNDTVQLTRDELNELVRSDIEATVDVLETTIERAGLAPADLADVFLVGGSSRIVLVADRIWRRLGLQRAPRTFGDPKLVVALGAARWHAAAAGLGHSAAATVALPPPTVAPERSPGLAAVHAPTTVPTPAPAPAPSGGFRSTLGVAAQTVFWRAGGQVFGQLRLENDGHRVLVADEPNDGGSTEALAERRGRAVLSRLPGYRELSMTRCSTLGLEDGLERAFVAQRDGQEVSYVERYVVAGPRRFVIGARADDATAMERPRLAARPAVPDAGGYDLRFEVEAPDGWEVVETVELVRAGSWQRVAAVSSAVDPLVHVLQPSGMRPAGTSSGHFLGGRQCSVTTAETSVNGSREVSRRWAGVVGARGYVISATVPARERVTTLALVQRHIRLHA